jgi:homoserine dehydrogenase
VTLSLAAVANRRIDRKRDRGLGDGVRWTEDLASVATDPGIDLVVELLGGIEPANALIRAALNTGKSVVTANKMLLARHGTELQALACEKGAGLGIEAAVAGGIPILRALRSSFTGDRVTAVSGILNGTCNFILTKMESTGTSFEAALKEAQRLGYAEADPSADVDGIDARAKLVILTQAGLGLRVRSEQIPCRSISLIESVDFLYARELNCTIRQISLAQKDTSKGIRLAAAVQPALIPAASLIAHAQGSQNLITATGEFAGRMIFSGYGAGGDPTAVAVISDLYSIARSASVPPEALPRVAEVPDSVSGDFTVPHYLRFVVRDHPGIVAALATILAKYQISIDALLQKPGFPHSALSFVMTLEVCDSAVLNRALEEISRLDFHVEPPLCLPIFVD